MHGGAQSSRVQIITMTINYCFDFIHDKPMRARVPKMSGPVNELINAA